MATIFTHPALPIALLSIAFILAAIRWFVVPRFKPRPAPASTKHSG